MFPWQPAIIGNKSSFCNCFKYHSPGFICFSTMLAPVIPSLDEIYCGGFGLKAGIIVSRLGTERHSFYTSNRNYQASKSTFFPKEYDLSSSFFWNMSCNHYIFFLVGITCRSSKINIFSGWESSMRNLSVKRIQEKTSFNLSSSSFQSSN